MNRLLVSSLSLCWLSFVFGSMISVASPVVVQNSDNAQQSTYGGCSSNFNNVTGNITINCPGVPTEIVEHLTITLSNTNAMLAKEQNRSLNIQEKLDIANRLINSYEKLKAQISKEPSTREIDNQIDEMIKTANFNKAKKLLKSKIRVKNLQQAKDYNKLGLIQSTEENYREALASFKMANQIEPENRRHLYELGFTYESLKEYDKAIESFMKGLAIDLKTYGSEHKLVAAGWSNLSIVLRDHGQVDKAIEYGEKALTSDLKNLGPDHRYVARDWYNLGLALHRKGRPDKAIEYYEKSLASDLKRLGAQHPDVVKQWNNLAASWYSEKEYEKAKSYIEKSFEVNKKMLGSNHPSTIKSKKWLDHLSGQTELVPFNSTR